jgi:multicomponent K+:H+ antiporter subunit A
MLTTLGLIIGVPFLFSAITLLVARRSPSGAGWLALVAPAAVIALGIPLWMEVGGGGRILVPLEWFPTLGISASLMVDRLGAFFVLLIGIVGLGVVQYSRHYMAEKATPGFWGLLLAFMGSMLGIVLSDSLILLFVFWEMTTITSALLIGLGHADGAARRGAIQAFLVTGTGGLALLGGVILLGQIAGTYELSQLAGMSELVLAHPLHQAAFVLILLGAFTKSAQFPFSFWLPGAMAAPAPISAYLHSATMVKAGIFLLGRMFPIFAESPLWLPILATVGLLTFFMAGIAAIRAYDLKQLLAHSTVAYLGVLTALYGYAAETGLEGELLHILNHALYKSSLFLLIGWLEKAMGTRDLAVLGPERWIRREPMGAALIGIGALAMAGLPFLLGFMSKEVFIEAILGGSTFAGIALADLAALSIAVVASGLAFAYAMKLFHGTFFGSVEPPADRGYPAKKISPWLLAVPAVLLVPQVVGGVIPAWYLGSVLEPGTRWPDGFAFWHYLDALLVTSLSMFTLGVLLYLRWERLAALRTLPGPERASDGVAGGAVGFASWLSYGMQRGGHPRYVSVILLACVAAMAGGIWWGGADPAGLIVEWGPDFDLAWFPATLIIAASIATLVVKRRIPKVIMMAMVGFGVAVFYVLFRAPDLALTQLLVETVSLILLLLVFRRLPELEADKRPVPRRLLHGFTAIVVGLAMGALAWSAGTHMATERTGQLHLQLSDPLAKGYNVVNVILVDFRGLDTFGEIVVLAIAALGAVALLRVRRKGEGVDP